jgi:hypothetical protein
MSEDIVDILKPAEEQYGSIKLRKPTAGTLSLCDFAKLKIASGGVSEVPFFEAIAFFYIHANPLKDVRAMLFDNSQGRDDNGCSMVFVSNVLEWADQVELGGITDMGEKIGEMLTEAMNPKVEPTSESSTDEKVSELVTGVQSKKKEAPPPPS